MLNSAPNMPRARKTAKKPTRSKSDFIRAQPATLSAAEVVAKAKSEGIQFAPVLVYKVRGRAKTKGKTKKPSAKASPSPTSGPVTNKAAFVRALGSLAPKEIVEKAKAVGVELDVGYVYNVRGAAKMAAKKKRAAAKGSAVSAVVSTATWSVAKHAETLLRAVASEIGLGRAIELLHDERARVHSIVRE